MKSITFGLALTLLLSANSFAGPVTRLVEDIVWASTESRQIKQKLIVRTEEQLNKEALKGAKNESIFFLHDPRPGAAFRKIGLGRPSVNVGKGRLETSIGKLFVEWRVETPWLSEKTALAKFRLNPVSKRWEAMKKSSFDVLDVSVILEKNASEESIAKIQKVLGGKLVTKESNQFLKKGQVMIQGRIVPEAISENRLKNILNQVVEALDGSANPSADF